MKPQPKPVTGAIFGFFFGVVIVALLWQLGVLAPDRLIVFGIVALVMMIGTFALTQRVSLVRKRFVVVVVFAALLGGVALTGIPEFVSGGSISDGCTIEASSSLSSATSPADTSATAPFRAAVTDDVPWVFATGPVLSAGTNEAGMMIAGFEIPTWSGTFENPSGVNEISGTANVQDLQDRLKDDTGLTVFGIYHVYGFVHAPEQDCDADGYLLVAPASAFDTPVLIGLWGLALILFIVILTLGIGVRRSIRTSERLTATTPADAAVVGTTTNPPIAPVPPADADQTGAASSATPVADQASGYTTETTPPPVHGNAPESGQEPVAPPVDPVDRVEPVDGVVPVDSVEAVEADSSEPASEQGPDATPTGKPVNGDVPKGYGEAPDHQI